MKIGAYQKFSMIDYPGKLSAIVFTQGCNFNCPYCHNPELVKPGLFTEPISESSFMDFLQSRIGKLDAVSITGGEPTLHKDLPEFISLIKDIGFLVKLDTNGTNPDMLETLIKAKIIDYIAMDIKAPLHKYDFIAKTSVNISKVKHSVNLIKSSKLEHEFRTTVTDILLSENDIYQIQKDFGPFAKYFIQKFRSIKTLEKQFEEIGTMSDVMLERINDYFANEEGVFEIR